MLLTLPKMIVTSAEGIKCRIPGTRPTYSPVNFTSEHVGQIIFFNFSDSLVYKFAKALVNMLAEALMNVLVESLVNIHVV